MTKSESILKTLKAHLPELREMGVKKMYVFGSVARGEDNPHDVDVLVDFIETPTLIDIVFLQEKIKELIGLDADIVTPGGCSPRLMKNIQKDLQHVA